VPVTVIRALAALPHRGATTANERRAADLLEELLIGYGAEVTREPFRTPTTYIWPVWWMLGAMIAGLVGASFAPWPALVLVGATSLATVLYFDWRWSPASLLPPRGRSENIVARQPVGAGEVRSTTHTGDRTTLVLMAHYDSAPVSLLYLPSMVKGFRRSLIASLLLTMVAVGIVLLEALEIGPPFVTWARWALAVYFLAQGVAASFDYFRHGFTNGAADNASGTGAAVATARRLWASPPAAWDIVLVLTGAEEVGMVGAAHYFRRHRAQMDPSRTVVLNFDNVGSGALKVITETGSLTPVVYDSDVVRAALAVAAEEARFSAVKPAAWHIGDFDTLIFARAGIPSLTLSAQDARGLVPHLHRPDDVLEHVDLFLPAQAADFAWAVVDRLARDRGRAGQAGEP